MAAAPAAAERRVNLIREMARQRESTRSRSSGASSVGSAHDAVYDFNVGSQPLTHLHMSNRQHTESREQEDFQINTSTLRRAFPDFSQSISSEEDSIEFGRGARKISRRANQAPPSVDTTDDNVVFTMNDGISYQVTATPPYYKGNASKNRETIKQNSHKKASPLKRAASNKENQDPAVKIADFEPSLAKNLDHKERQGLAEIYSHDMREHSDVHIEPRPPAASSTTKNTRFSHGRGSNFPNAVNCLPKSFKSTNALLQSIEPSNVQMTPQSRNVPSGGINPTYSSGTYQSFILPDLPNLTELVSGEGQDANQNVPHSTKSKSRFGSHSQKRQIKPQHLPVQGIPIPEDEKALYVSLQLLQEKVAELEKEKAQNLQKFETYENEIIDLKVQLQQREASREHDSGIGTDMDDAGKRNWTGDRTKLELSIKRLQDRLEEANRKVSVSEITVQNLTKDRNAAHAKLAMANRNSDELQGECEKVHHDIEKLKAQLKSITKRHEKKIEKLTKQETELRGKLDRRGKAVEEMSSLTKEIWNTRAALAATQNFHPQQFPKQKVETREMPVNDPVPTRKRASRTFAYHDADLQAQIHREVSTKSLPNKVSREYESEVESTTNINIAQRDPVVDWLEQHDLTKNSEYESFMEGDEAEKLRKVLDDDLAKLAAAKALTEHENNKRNVADPNTQTQPQTVHLRRKSSLKDTKGMVKGKTIRDDICLKDHLKHQRRSMEDLQQQKQSAQRTDHIYDSERRRRSDEPKASADLTSAFILQDVTLSNIDRTGDVPILQTTQANSVRMKRKTIVSRPIPVSDRQVSATNPEEDVTLRPAQSPAEALAIVLHDLEQEVAHLHVQLTAQERLYNQHDPALERRKRKKVYTNIQRLLAAIEIHSERIYRLYDVLEGQKASGALMTEDEIEVTLRDIGLDGPTMPVRSGISLKQGLTSCKSSKKTVVIAEENAESDGLSDSSESGDEDEEVPWEGLDATQSLRSLPVPTLTLEYA